MAQIGEIIDGKYEILHEIGRGGMSIVYLAMDKRLNKQWAIKEFRKDKGDASRELALNALLDEANLMKKLDHPMLPRIVDIIDSKATIYIVMDYIEGESLNRVVDATGAQPQEAVIEWAKQLCAVLDYLHTLNPPVIYRDMKPANIMLKPDGTVRLIDFGIAREYKEGKDGDTEAIGTRGYAAPEQFGGKGQTDARTDIYSLGVTLYHLVTGKNPAEPPYEIYPIRHWNPTLSSGLEWLIQKCTQLNPADRYQSCAEITYVLENLDKFEVEYKKKQRSRIGLFWAATILTLVFSASAAGCFLSARTTKTNDYEVCLSSRSIEGYVSAIDIDSERPEAYAALASELRNVKAVYANTGAAPATLGADERKEQDLVTWFSNERLERLRVTSPETYVSVNYELGRLLWNCYIGPNDNPNEGAYTAHKYFANVIETASQDEAHLGLSNQKYNLAKAYYLVSFFQINKANLGNLDDGDFQVEPAGIAAGVYGADADGTLSNAYYSYWMTCKNLLSFLDDESEDVNPSVKLASMERLAYILSENYAMFYDQTRSKEEKVNGAEMQEMYHSFQIALSHIEETDDNRMQLERIKQSLNLTAKMVEAKYSIELEEIK